MWLWLTDNFNHLALWMSISQRRVVWTLINRHLSENERCVFTKCENIFIYTLSLGRWLRYEDFPLEATSLASMHVVRKFYEYLTQRGKPSETNIKFHSFIFTFRISKLEKFIRGVLKTWKRWANGWRGMTVTNLKEKEKLYCHISGVILHYFFFFWNLWG